MMSAKKEANDAAVPNGGWGVYTDEKDPKLLSNFYIEVIHRIDSYSSSESKPTSKVRLRLSFGTEQYSEEFIEPLSELEKIKWLDKDIRCRLYPGVAPSKAQRYLADMIRKKLPDAPQKNQHQLKRLGMHVIEGEPVYCTGEGLVRPSPGIAKTYDIQIDPMPYTLDIDQNLSEEEATADMFELISLFPDVGRILLAYNLMCLMWEPYKAAWKAPRFCLYIYGPTASLKTTLSSFISQVYNRSKGIANPPRLNSSIPKAVELIYEKDHCAIILDDLFPSDSSQIQVKQEETLSETSRIIGDGVEPGRVKGCDNKMEPPTVGLIFTGEYLIGTESTASRILPIEVAPPDNETLQRLAVFQKDKPLAISTFYHNLIQWFITNYAWAQEFLKEWWDAYSKSDFEACYGMVVHGRLKETHFNLNTAYVMFLEYCSEKGFISKDEAEALHQSFLKLITGLALEQQDRVVQGKLSKSDVKVDYLAFIRKLYIDGTFKLAASAKEFDVKVHDGVIHLGRLNIYGERFREIVGTANANLDEVLDDLEARGALHHGKNERTTQIFDTGKRRFYAIKLTHLK